MDVAIIAICGVLPKSCIIMDGMLLLMEEFSRPYRKSSFELNGGGSTPRISLQGKGSGYSYYSLGLSRSFLKEERLSLNIYCSNVLEKYRTYNNHTEGANFISKSSSKYPSRYYGFSISYRLGELKPV